MNAEPAANPFAQDVEQPLPGPTTLVIFGATGDLAARKLLPAIYNLGLGGLLPERFEVIGIGRRAGDSEAFRRARPRGDRGPLADRDRGGRLAGARAAARLPARRLRRPELFEALKSQDRGERWRRPGAAGLLPRGLGHASSAPIAKALAQAGWAPAPTLRPG